MEICFLEEKPKLWTEVCIRGWLAAILDFPHLKNAQAVSTASLTIPDALRSEVCCIPPDDDFKYRQLVVNAWCSSYASFEQEQVSEREKFLMASVLKDMSPDEALAFMRQSLSDGRCSEFDRAYAEFCDKIQA